MKKQKNDITSARLKKAMEEKNINAATLSKKSGVSEASLSQYINGSHAPSNITAGKIASVLDCSPLYLMGFDIEVEKSADPRFERLYAYYKALSANQKDQLEDYMEFLKSKNNKEE